VIKNDYSAGKRIDQRCVTILGFYATEQIDQPIKIEVHCQCMLPPKQKIKIDVSMIAPWGESRADNIQGKQSDGFATTRSSTRAEPSAVAQSQV